MKKIRLATLLFAISAFIFSSCRKEPQNTTCTPSSTTIAGTYNIVAATYKESSTSVEIDYFKAPYTAPCERDDIITYNTDGTYQYKDGGTVCSPLGNTNGTWVFVGTTSMQMNGDNYIIDSFDCKTLITIRPNKFLQGDRLKITLARQ